MTTETPKKTKPKKKYKKRKTKLSYGPRGLETLRLCFQCGGATPQQHSRFLDTNIRNSYRILSSLADQRLLESAPVQTNGRPRDFHFLSKANAGRGIALGGYEAGLEERRAKKQYKLPQLPQHVEHRHTLNEVYLLLLEASRTSGIEVPLWSMWAESFRGFPLHSAKKSEAIYPDGVFEVQFGGGLTCRYLIEYESRSRPDHVLQKLDAYGAHFARLLKENPDNMSDWLRPLIFLFSRHSTALHVAKTVSGATIAKAPELSRYMAWRAAASKRGINAGQLILFASLETLEARSALGIEYVALEKYEDDLEGVGAGGNVVDLEMVADGIDEAVGQ